MDKTDYFDPSCYCDTDFYKENTPVVPSTGVLSMEDVIREYDSLIFSGDYQKAGSFLKEQLDLAREYNDLRSQLSIQNEFLGFHRQYGNVSDEWETIADCRNLLSKLNLKDGYTAGNILLNIGTAYCALHQPKEAILAYSDACRSWDKIVPPTHPDFANLYNNMASAYDENGEFDFAVKHYERAIVILEEYRKSPNLAISYLSLACLFMRQNAEDERIWECADKASLFLASFDRKDGYYYYVMQKCVQPLQFLGLFRLAKQYEKEVKAFHERA